MQNLSIMFPNKLWDTFTHRDPTPPVPAEQCHRDLEILSVSKYLQRRDTTRTSYFCEQGACQGLWAGAEGHTPLEMAVPWTQQFPWGRQSKAVFHADLILPSVRDSSELEVMEEK